MKVNKDTTLNQISDLKNLIETEIENIDNSENNVYEHLRKKSLESKLKRLVKIEEIFQIEKHNIVFIGTIGVGKTTAICHLFNLIGDFEKEDNTTKIKKTIKYVDSLLSTGSGRTTISEVIIKQSNKTYIEIEPYPKEKLESMIIEFCENLYNENDGQKAESTISVEMERAIRSIINLKKNQKIKDKNGNEKTVDIAEETAKKIPIEELKTLAFKNANLDSRKFTQLESKLICPEDAIESKWLNQTFEKINKGEEKTFSIPKKIFVYVSNKILKESELSLFNSIIDTKGIDENPIRPDLREYIEKEENICLFTTSFNDSPEANVRELMKFSLTQRSKNYEQRFICLVLPHKGEPEKENDSDGTWDGGIKTRKSVIKNVFQNANLEFLEDNIIFYDALRCYDSKGRKDQDFEDSDIQDFKNEVIYSIYYSIDRRYEILLREIETINERFLKIKNGQGLSDEVLQSITLTIGKIRDLKSLNSKIPGFVYDEFISKYVEYYALRYPAWNTKDAIHRRLGTFEERGFDTYFDAKIIAEGIEEDEMLKKFTSEIYIELVDYINTLGEKNEDIQSLTSEIIKRLSTYYDTFVESVGDDFQKYLRDKNENNTFWFELISRRGKGSGYNADVCTMLSRKLEYVDNRISASRVLQEKAENNWRKLIDKVLSFFE